MIKEARKARKARQTAPAKPNLEALADIRQTLLHAGLFHEAWWAFEGDHPKRDDIVRALDYYAGFFGAITPALWTAYIVRLASLFDDSPDSISLADIPEIEKEPGYAELREKGRRLFRYRSKVIAHRDRRVGKRNFAKETGFTYDDFPAIWKEACRLFNAAAIRLKVEPVPSFSCEGDLLRLADDLNRHRAELAAKHGLG